MRVIYKVGHFLSLQISENLLYYIQQQENTMEYSSTLADMLHNPQHPNFKDTCYRSEELTYRLEDNTLYYLTSFWGYEFRTWLNEQGIAVPDNKRMYTPVAKLVKGKLIGYNTQYANIGNRFLEMSDGMIKSHYPNLYLVEVGNHPYPKECRYHHSWVVEAYLRECHQILNPPSDPKEFFLQPSSFPSIP